MVVLHNRMQHQPWLLHPALCHLRHACCCWLQAAPSGLALFNPSVVQYSGSYYAATRSLKKEQIGDIEWWLSGAHFCVADGSKANFEGSSCTAFDPWQARCARYLLSRQLSTVQQVYESGCGLKRP
jgi:hypothetical protein